MKSKSDLFCWKQAFFSVKTRFEIMIGQKQYTVLYSGKVSSL